MSQKTEKNENLLEMASAGSGWQLHDTHQSGRNAWKWSLFASNPTGTARLASYRRETQARKKECKTSNEKADSRECRGREVFFQFFDVEKRGLLENYLAPAFVYTYIWHNHSHCLLNRGKFSLMFGRERERGWFFPRIMLSRFLRNPFTSSGKQLFWVQVRLVEWVDPFALFFSLRIWLKNKKKKSDSAKKRRIHTKQLLFSFLSFSFVFCRRICGKNGRGGWSTFELRYPPIEWLEDGTR